ncbi:BglG family transcription antiterminator [Vagococcus sp.]|uniref:BglG family transcription antiterminator n=1 Tax=Vagococcus sp. TaxID=1933889 RepID=UPI002FC85082
MDSRLPTLFLLICKEQQEHDIKNLAEKMSVSTRTIYNDIKKLNELLIADHHEEIKIDKGNILYTDVISSSFEKLTNLDFNYILSHPRIRRLRLLAEVLMFKDYFSIDDLIKKLPLSRNTIISDLKWVKEELAFYQIEMISRPFTGYKIVGDEQDIRHLLTATVLEDPLSFENKQSEETYLAYAEELLEMCGDELKVSLSDSSYDRLKIIFWVTFKRIEIEKEIKIKSSNTKEEHLFLDKKADFERVTKLLISDNELIYLAQKFIESSFIHYNDEITEKWMDFNFMTDRFIKKVSDLSGCDFFIEDTRLYEGVINHLRPAYHRVMSHSQIKNPMFDYIINSFSELHGNVCEGIKIVEKNLGMIFSENEVSFFTLFFVASIEKQKRYPTKPKKIIIVCDSGVSTSQILRSKLEVNFDVQILGTLGKRTAGDWLDKNEVDLVISTVNFEYPGKTCIKVTPFVTEEDMKKLYVKLNSKKEKVDILEMMTIIKQTVSMDENQSKKLKQELMRYLRVSEPKIKEKGVYQPMLVEVLHEGLIKVNSQAKTRDDAVRASGQLLVDNGLAKFSYVDGMLENVAVNGTYIVIAPGIAMPHARPETGALDIGLSIVTLEEPVVFGHPQNDPVSIVVGLCAVDHQSHLKALSELVEILSDEEKIKKINKALTSEEIMSIINSDVI